MTAAFASRERAHQALERLAIQFSAIDVNAAVDAGKSWREYRSRGGTRERIVGDVLVASHAQLHADRLLTRNRGFYRSHFSGLTVVDPSDPASG